ncbi:MAG: hypothetical protein KDB23_14595 [Planctomycetales bacterium]|nr:hypothetical protein [Planctomycetales bacterium]
MNTHCTRDTWYLDRETRLTITCDHGQCLAEIVVSDGSVAIDVEVLRCVGSLRGIVVGHAVAVYRERILTTLLPDARRRVGRLWLPTGLGLETLRDCFYRITPVSLDKPASTVNEQTIEFT